MRGFASTVRRSGQRAEPAYSECASAAGVRGPRGGHRRASAVLIRPARSERLKLWGRARVIENAAALVDKLFDKGYKAKPERAILFTIEAWDVNCSSHIVTRFTEAEIEQALATVQTKIAELEAENARLRALLADRAS